MAEDPRPQRPAPPLTPPKVAPPRSAPRGSGLALKPTTLVAAAVATLLLLAAGMFWVLPAMVTSSNPADQGAGQAAAPTAAAPAAPPTDEEAVALQKAKRQAEALLGQLLRTQAELLDAKVEIWAETEFDQLLTQLAAGDTQFENQAYHQALASYQAVEAGFQALQDSRPQRLARALEQGEATLEVNAVERAIAHFGIALALAPDHPQASRGLARAQARPEVLAHMESGETHRRQGALEEARKAFVAALQRDPAYGPAQRALRAVEAEIIDQRFAQAMSGGYQALDAGRFDDAAKAFAAARRLKPNATETDDAMARLEQARQKARLTVLQAAAARDVAAEAWAAAVDAYQEALAIDPNIAFAVQGLAEAAPRARMDAAAQGFITQPQRLYSPQPRANAQELLDSMARVEQPGPKLQAQKAKLSALLAAATTPVPVRIASDGQTEVSLFGIGKLGQFNEQAMKLLPGDYVAFGSRKGYRDVRLEFSVRPGDDAKSITVMCKEPV